MIACQEDFYYTIPIYSYKDDIIPVLFDILNGKWPQKAKISAIKAISCMLGPKNIYFIQKLEKKYVKYRLISKVNKKVIDIRNELKAAIDKIKNKPGLK